MNVDWPVFGTAIAACLAALLAFGGCAKFDLDKFDMRKNIPWGAGRDGELKAPMKVVAVWTDTVLTEGMKPATRGFGGRLMFYDVEGGKPIQVRGSLMVYAFDETGRDVENTKPDRKFVFTTEQFEKHYSKSSLGHSYSVWLPWDAAGGPLKEISLLVRFTPDNGPVVIGDAARQHLPGSRTSDPTKYPDPPVAQRPLPSAPADGVQLVAYDAPAMDPTAAANSSNPPRRMSTTTISLPTGTDALRRTGFAQPTQPGFGATTEPAAPNASYSSRYSTAPTSSSGFAGSAAGSTAPAASAGSPSGSPAAHFEPTRRRPLGAPLARLERGRVPWQHSLEAPPSSLPNSQ